MVVLLKDASVGYWKKKKDYTRESLPLYIYNKNYKKALIYFPRESKL